MRLRIRASVSLDYPLPVHLGRGAVRVQLYVSLNFMRGSRVDQTAILAHILRIALGRGIGEARVEGLGCIA